MAETRLDDRMPPAPERPIERPDAPGPPPPVSGGDGPPPPPAAPGSAGESRATAATWVAAVGALLLLAAAGTFLAVSWEALGLTARVAVVAAATGAAILGGHRLRRSLPAVGAVLFHLGALLVPIDVLGLALQLDASPATRWIAVGATATLVLPVLAVAGRSPMLAWGAIAGVPVLATGLGLLGTGVLGAGTAALLVAGAAAASTAAIFATDDATSTVLSRYLVTVTWVLGAVAVYLPVVVAVVDAVPGTAGVFEQVAAAGWLPISWERMLLAGTVAVLAIGTVATRARSRPLLGLAMMSAVVVTLTTLIPAATPDAVRTVLPALLVVLVQFAALIGRSDELWETPTRLLATATEWLVLLGTAPLLLAALIGRSSDLAADAGYTIAMVLLGVAWLVATIRRAEPRGMRSGLVPFLAGLAVVQAALAVSSAGLALEVVVLVLLAGAVGTLVLRADAEAEATARDAALAGAGVAVLLSGVAVLFALQLAIVAAAVITVVVVTGLHVRAVGARTESVVDGTLWLVVPTAVGTVLIGALALETSGHADGWGSILAIVSLLGLAAAVDVRPMVADAVRTVMLPFGLVATSTLLGADSMAGSASSRLTVTVLGLGLTAVVPSAIVSAWLAADAFRLRRPLLALLAAPVAVRLVASVGLAAGWGTQATGLALLAVAVAAALAAVYGVGRWTTPTIVLAVSAAGVGLPLAELGPELRAVLVIAIGLVVAAAGAARRNGLIGHVGGAIAVIGTWQLLGLRQVEALDLWVLPLAAQLWVAGILVRRRGGSSSWVTDVPPLLLVAIPALIERASGGGGWHAVLAGGLGVVAVIAGGSERLGGPLVVGTLVLVAVVGVETFAVVAAVPTWAWLAIGGATLLGAGAAMEKVGGSPVKAARRLVDVVRERFD